MKLDTILGVARAEARSIRRLVRYWIFLTLASFFGVAGYLYYAAIHGFFSSYSGSVGATSPKYMVAPLGIWFLLVFIVGLVFLAFDVRARDQRERMLEVLDSRPYSNAELLTGRFLGMLVAGWVPVLGIALVLYAIGWLGQALSWPMCEPPEPKSLLNFVVFMAIPALAFFLALVFFVALLVRNRLLAAVLGLGALGLSVWGFLSVPVMYQPAVDVFGGFSLTFPTELLTEVVTLQGLGQRLAVLLLACGFLAFAAAIHPRLDGGSTRTRVTVGAACSLGGLALLAVVASVLPGAVRTFETFQAAHEARRGDPIADLESISGQVTIDPGRLLNLELELRVAARTERLESLLFSFNPGLEVERVADASGQSLEFTHQHGLLDVSLKQPLGGAEAFTLSLAAAGRPAVEFGYLDSAKHFWDVTGLDMQLFVLGVEAGLNESRFVALMPGNHWLPTPGPEVGRDDPARRPADFFDLDLVVEVPEGWLTAGPGRRRDAPGATPGRARFRYAPPAPVPEVALIASRFEARSIEIEGVQFEVLLAPFHTRNLDVLAEAGPEIQEWVGERLREAAELGLPYPYDAFTLVETPAILRGYGGGWRMDTTMAPPAMMLMRESGFPTTRFDSRFRNPKQFEDQEGGLARAKWTALAEFFEADVSGGNVFLGVARNFFAYQTAAEGPEGLALNFVLHDLTTRLVTGREGFFSAHVFDSSLNDIVGAAITGYLGGRGDGETLTTAVLRAVIDRPEVWDQAMGTALTEMDPWEDPGRTVSTLGLKGGAMARWILDGLGREKAGALLAALRSRATGRTFDAQELLVAAQEAEVDLPALLGDWLDRPDLPGFVASDVRHVRLADEEGSPRYQVAFHLRNDEPAPGLIRLEYRAGEEEADRGWERGEPIRVPGDQALEIGLVTSRPVRRLRVAPYLALNRRPFELSLPTVAEEKLDAAEPLRGTRPSDWAPSSEAIVVDDLDAGFSIEAGTEAAGLRLGAQQGEDSLDQGLPACTIGQPPGQPPVVWSRQENALAWGKYRHTLAVIRGAQEGGSRAVFRADVESSGRWRLELHLPPPGRGGHAFTRGWRSADYNLVLAIGPDREEIGFDAAGAEEGWNRIGEYELAAGEVRVELSSASDGRAVFADAIRWLPVSGT